MSKVAVSVVRPSDPTNRSSCTAERSTGSCPPQVPLAPPTPRRRGRGSARRGSRPGPGIGPPPGSRAAGSPWPMTAAPGSRTRSRPGPGSLAAGPPGSRRLVPGSGPPHSRRRADDRPPWPATPTQRPVWPPGPGTRPRWRPIASGGRGAGCSDAAAARRAQPIQRRCWGEHQPTTNRHRPRGGVPWPAYDACW